MRGGTTGYMDLEQRIEALERQVGELTEMIRQMAAPPARHGSPARGLPPVEAPVPAASPPRPNMRTSSGAAAYVAKVLGGKQGESLEARVGGIWLSRVAVVMLMTCIVLGARITLYSEAITPVQKLGVFYAVAACGVAYGLLRRGANDLFAQAVLGAGLATLYFTTYAAFFVDEMRVSSQQVVAIPLLLGCLGIVAGVSHWRRSQTVAGVSLFLVYYTVVASCMSGANGENLYYALLTCLMLSVVAVTFHALHRWLLFAWGALIATYVVYLYFFLVKPGGLAMPDREYFWLSNGFLAMCYVSFACAGIVDARKTGEYRRGIAPMAGVNSCVFIVLGWYAVRHVYPHEEWMFRLGLAGLLFGFAALLDLTGPRGNYLFQVYMAKCVVMLTLAFQAYFSGETLMVAISLECVALAFSYKRSGIVTFKVLGMLLLLVTFAGSLFQVRATELLSVFGYIVQANWFCCAGSAIVLSVVSCFYTRFIRRVRPEQRITHGQWFLADTLFDVRSATAALLYATAAALILMAVTIADRGDDVRMPFMLAGEGLLMILAGLLMRTAQLEIGGVLLVAASHVCYHTFLAGSAPGFDRQPHFALYTVAVALFTYAGAYLWELYLRRAKGGRPWEHHTITAIPYLAATVMLTTLMKRDLAGMQIPLGQDLLGVALLAVGVATGYTAVKASGLVALGIGAVSFSNGLYAAYPPYHHDAYFLPYLGAILLAYTAGERLFVVLERRERTPARSEEFLRTLIVAGAALLGMAGVSRYALDEQRTLYWLALAVGAVGIGAIVGESRYRWTALALFAAAIVRAYAYDLRSLPPFYQFLSFAALSVPLIAISWGYSHYRGKALQHHETSSEDDSRFHGNAE
ncbi:MAG: DUF2339 domain-containing protein [Candidatus Hydrogenedentes bacterium]|nr:DUF2339 domain-containing protein [Candidatus Hydrogenedentota bacterium]